ncbi:hypothetical protein [Spirosoma sordidisoli]|uniref:Uncharacterized protein n=1 Tax=Spirosoma sordidisoli TaxID=2502893 RepID=A0A4Q2UM37_9BACT|nr:hypothetical protein [Spirosoma sordidisoli]RYC68575.1 hypothetical protein EQG79_19710 [Spirosoma sordidisoli]
MLPALSPAQSFADAYKATRVIETLENYAVADQLDTSLAGGRAQSVMNVAHESDFWRTILANPDNTADIPVSLNQFTLSDWVPRVPGLFWSGNATRIRIRVADGRAIYDPFGKSQFVLGGIGTNLLAPDPGGQRVACLVRGRDVSGGIPMVISNRIWRRLSLEPGLVLTLTEVWWQLMTEEWQQRFDSVKDIPRAYLCVDDESQVQVVGKREAPGYQPYSLIEYVKDDVLQYDYVFRTIYPGDSRQEVADFFEMYRMRYGYNGRYLISPDPVSPLFDAVYSSPLQLRQARSGAQFHLELLKENIRETYFGGTRGADILSLLSRSYRDTANINMVATQLGFPTGTFASSVPADQIAQLVDWCVDTPGKMEELIDKLTGKQPELLLP